MPVTKLIIGGFRSIAKTIEIPLAPITLLLGPNSAGKSAIKDAMLALKDAMLVSEAEPGSIERENQSWRHGARDAHLLSEPQEGRDGQYLEMTLGCQVELFQENVIGRYWPTSNDEVALELTAMMYGQSVDYSLTEPWIGYRDRYYLKVNSEEALRYVDNRCLEDELSLRGKSIPELNVIQKSYFSESGWLCINLDAIPFSNLQFQDLVSSLLRSVDGDSFGVFWEDGRTLNIRCNQRAGQIYLFQEYFLATSGSLSGPDGAYTILRSVLYTINETLRQVEMALVHELDLALVSGARTSLSVSDVSTPEESTYVLPSPHDPISRDGKITSYAHWLGLISVYPELPNADNIKRLLEKDDFVNDVLSKDFFLGRRYQVKPEVTHRLTRVLGGRQPEDEDESKETVQTTLYLQDQHGRNLDFHQVGSGVSFILPVLAALWGAPRSWIEQPELHLHPAAQCEMGDAVVMAFNRGRFSVIETHSEHMLLRILKRIRQTSQGKITDPELRCQPEAVAVLYFDPQEDGTTSVHQLRVTRGGDFLDRWPRGFFEERNAELFDE